MLVVGKIVGFHGLKGEVKLAFSERLEKNLQCLNKYYVYPVKKECEILEIDSFRVHKSNILLKFKEYNSKTEVEHLKGALLKQNKELLAPLDNEEYFIDDLIGINIFDQTGIQIGKVVAVYSGNTPNDVLEIQLLNGKEVLVPFVEEFVPVVRLNDNKLVVSNISGLIDD